MNTEKKLKLLEEIMDLEEGELTPQMQLKDIEQYSSMAKLSLIALMNDEFSKKLTNEQMKKFITVKDILDYMDI